MVRDFISLFFPNYCFTCYETLVRGEEYLCTNCRPLLPKTEYHLLDTNPLMKNFGGLVPFANIYTYLKFNKKGKVQKIMEKLKYSDCPEIGTVLGKWYGADLSVLNLKDEIDIIIPVPLHRSKIKKRGYNQSDFFAKGLSMTLGVEWDAGVLKRKQKNQSQTRKGRKERFENVMGIFEVVSVERVIGKRILLVDDVITTGATLYACATPLVAAGAKSISICTLAVAQ